MSAPTRQPRRRGFLLVNILVVLMLLGAFMLAATRVFRLSILSTQSASREQERALRLEQAMRALRADVWQASAVQSVQPNQLQLTTGDSPVRWDIDGEGNLTRSAGKDSQSWSTLNMTFSGDGRAILVKRKDEPIAVLEQGVPR
jgi:type II secretory pathway pseudopilin PulG